jgi:hypothetical protein
VAQKKGRKPPFPPVNPVGGVFVFDEKGALTPSIAF